MTWDRSDVEKVISEHPVPAAEALAAVQFQLDLITAPLTVDGLVLAAAVRGVSVESLWVDQLDKLTLLQAFVQAMRSRGVRIDDASLDDLPEFASSHYDLVKLESFTPRAKSFRCRVQVNGRFAGTGCLIGPSLVLTAWHVIAVAAPSRPQQPVPRVQVELSDGTIHRAFLPACFESLSGDDEYRSIAPRADLDVAGRNDVALLTLERPVGTHLGYAPLPSRAPKITTQSAMSLLHFPAGKDRGLGMGVATRIPGVTARWLHSIPSRRGSSGGACFNGDLELMGLHQGKWSGGSVKEGGRLVPLARFIDDVRPLVERDITPLGVWSLSGDSSGAIVIGRSLLFETLAAAAGDTSRVRGLRVKRRNPLDSPTRGLAFSFEVVQHMLNRRGGDHIIVRVPMDDTAADLVESIRRRVGDVGLNVLVGETALGVAPGQATTEAVAKDRALRLATNINTAATAADRRVWCYFDHPPGVLSETNRLVLEGFIAGALAQPRIRLVLTGLETWPIPGQEFAAPSAAVGEGSTGLVVEYIGGFRRDDIRDLLAAASRDLTGQQQVDLLTDQTTDLVLQDLHHFNGVYDDVDLPGVIDALRPALRLLQQQGRER